MNSEHRIEKLLALYSLLLRMMPFEHRRKFSGEMEQLFCDRLRDAAREGVSLRRQALGMFAETLREIILQKVIEMKEARITHWVGSATLGILMIPLIGMQFSSEIKWTVFDFAVAGTALFLTGSAFAFVTRTSTNWTYKSAAVLALIATLFHFWANGAVGMIGSERDNFNGLYHVIPFVGLIGATLAQLKARMMAKVMCSMAGVHVAIGLLALLLDKHAGSMRAALEIIGVTGMFAALFLTSAWLFQRSTAGRARREPNA